MSKKYDVIDELIKDELREFLFWLYKEKGFEICELTEAYWQKRFAVEKTHIYFPIHKAPEDLINEYMEAE